MIRKRPTKRATAIILALSLSAQFAAQYWPAFRSTVQAYSVSPISEFEGVAYAVTTGNNLINFNLVTPGALNRSTALSGLAQGETVTGIDFRPRTGQLFGTTSASRLVVINTGTGAVTAVGQTLNPALTGTAFGLDFNPTVDRIRLVSDGEQNLRLNPDTGAVAGTDSALAYATGDANAGANPNLVGSAYTNNFNAATSTTLFGIDSNLDALVRQGSVGGAPVSPNTGQLFTVGALGFNTTDQVGFDIAAPGDTAVATLTAAGATTSSLYSINLNTGAATLVGAVGGTEAIRALAVITRVETIFAVNANNQLLRFNNGTPGSVTARPITGLGAGESVLGIDFRPADGRLYALTTGSRVYVLNHETGAATAAGAAFTPTLNGTAFGVDFNPVPDRIRVVSDGDQNLRLNPNNGAVAGTDSTLAFATGDANANANPNVVGVAYNNNVAGATMTTLFGIDSNLDALVLQGSPGGAPTSPNTGQLTTVGALGVNTTDQVGFDIAPQTNAAFASLTTGAAASSLYAINTTTGAATLLGEIGGGAIIRDIAVGIRVETIFALTAGNMLVGFNSRAPGTALSTTAITGLGAGESLVGIDYRPVGGQLYGLSTGSRVYTINPATGAATAVGAAFTPALVGSSFGVDFNPVPDRIRVTSNADQNLRLNPETGGVAGTDSTLAYASGDPNASANPNIVGAAYTNSVPGATSTTLFVIDSDRDALVRQGSVGGAPVSPNTGQLFTVGPLGVNTGEPVGLDIGDCSGIAYAALSPTGATTSTLYTINLLTGAATTVGAIAGTEIIRDIAVATNFVPTARQAGLAVTNAASFEGEPVAPDSIASLFGAFLTTGTATASSLPWPTTLAGVRVAVNGSDAGLIFVGPTQINFAVPASLSEGSATLTVTNANGTTRSGSFTVRRVAPGAFTFSATGQGTVAAVTTFDGVSFQSIINADGSERAVDPGTAARPNILVVFATGLRNAMAADPNDANGVAEAVTATIQTTTATVNFAGRAPGLEGVDQLNLVIPPALRGAGRVTLRLVVNGQTANATTFTIGN